MKCVNCGLPLSPTRTSCPRCGTSIGGKQASNPALGASDGWGRTQQSFPGQAYGASNTQLGVEMQPPPSQGWTMPTSWETPGVPFAHAGGNAGVQTPQTPPLSPQSPFPNNNAVVLPPAERITPVPEARPVPRAPFKAGQQKKQAMPFSLTVAALCVVTGGLMLIFVYVMSLSLSTQADSQTQSPTVTHTTPTTAVTPTSTPVLTPSPTALPGQQYIDNVQTASVIDPVSAAATTIASTFKVNQRIYIRFDLHPHNRSGAFCLIWYLNNKSVFEYHRAVVANSVSAYSYATYGNAGAGSVTIYWSPTDSCLDPGKALAERANFTITA